MYKTVPIDNNAVLYFEKPVKRVNFTLSVLTTLKKNEMKTFQFMETSWKNTSIGQVHYVKHLKFKAFCMN